MERIKLYNKSNGKMFFFCPACAEFHTVNTAVPDSKGKLYFFDGNKENPTIMPMIERVVESFNKDKHSTVGYVCNSFITNGQIRYTENSTNGMNGKTVELPELKNV